MSPLVLIIALLGTAAGGSCLRDSKHTPYEDLRKRGLRTGMGLLMLVLVGYIWFVASAWMNVQGDSVDRTYLGLCWAPTIEWTMRIIGR
jgi:hypothetical protein